MNELNISAGVTGLTYIATPYLAGVAQPDISLTELGASGIYQGDMTGAAGTYDLIFSTGGTIKGYGRIIWDGTQEVDASTVPAAVGSRIIEGSTTADMAQRIQLAALAGKREGIGSGTEKYYSQDGVTPRITLTPDALGNGTPIVDGAT